MSHLRICQSPCTLVITVFSLLFNLFFSYSNEVQDLLVHVRAIWSPLLKTFFSYLLAICIGFLFHFLNFGDYGKHPQFGLSDKLQKIIFRVCIALSRNVQWVFITKLALWDVILPVYKTSNYIYFTEILKRGNRLLRNWCIIYPQHLFVGLMHR